VEVRDNIDGACLVSGLVNTKDRSDQFAYDLLNNEESSFEFSKLVAFCDDIKFSKKRLLSRSARYTGLLDKLDFIQAENAGDIPTVAQLDGVKSWVAVVESTPENDVLAVCEGIAKAAKEASSVENVAILITNALKLDAMKCKSVVDGLNDDKMSYSIAAVGKIGEHGEGKIAYTTDDFGSEAGVLEEGVEFSREESLRMITDMLQLEAGENKALTFSEIKDVNATEAKLIKGLREAGYVRVQELDHMLREGVEAYQTKIDEWTEKNPDAANGYTTNAWWETEEFKKQVADAKAAEGTGAKDESEIEIVKDERAEEIEEIAIEWAKREFYLQSMSKVESTTADIQSEEEFIKSVWESALVEGDKKYREIYGEDTDGEAKLDDFTSKQEQKKKMMLKRAKEDLADILDEEDLLDGDDDLKEILSSKPQSK